MSETHPALSPTPADGVTITSIRERFAVAFAVYGGHLDEANRIKLASALTAASPVDAAVGAFNVLAAMREDEDPDAESPVYFALGAELLSRLIEAADIIAAHGFHGKTDEAAALATVARARLAELG